MEDEPSIPASVIPSDDWKGALEKVVPCCVVLKVTQTRAVDTEAAGCSCATGFIVDRNRGIILTNRHVVTPGPIVAEAIFLNREEVPVYPLYYDPVHDFAFFRFDPSKLQFMDVGEVVLSPESAEVGMDIRVVGNDSGEKLSILAGTLARLDRDAPHYGRKGYNDFNTFYFQAASGTKGGSSGSPVIDCYGRVVALNAGGKDKAATAYYLPLERIVRALRILQEKYNPASGASQWSASLVPRGDLQATFVYKGFEDVRRLGLRQETEKLARSATPRCHGAQGGAAVGMLVVENVLPGGPSDGVLQPGDVLVRVNGAVVTQFLELEDVLDSHVGCHVDLTVERGGLQLDASVAVQDLHCVTPSSFLQISGGSVHALSYQQARNNRVAVGAVYVAEPGYMLERAGVPKHAIIVSLNDEPTPDLASFAATLRSLAHGQRVPIEFYTFSERQRIKSGIMQMDRLWYGVPLLWTRDDMAGTWHSVEDRQFLPPAPPTFKLDTDSADSAGTPMAAVDGAGGSASEHDADASPEVSMVLGDPDVGEEEEEEEETDTDAQEGEEYLELLRRSMCCLDVECPMVALTDGVHAKSFMGTGLVVFHGRNVGLVVVDRNTVPVTSCDITLTFGAHPVEVPGRVRFLHPLHNFAIVSYDVSDLPREARASVRAAALAPAPALRRGEAVRLVCMSRFLRLMQRPAIVVHATAAVSIPAANPPRFRAVHEEVVKLDQDFGVELSGVVADDAGRVRALWCSYSEQSAPREEREWCAGMPAALLEPWVRQLALLDVEPLTPPPPVRVLDAELEPILLSKAAHFGLPPAWVSRLTKLDRERRQVLRVRGTVALSPAAAVLQCGDMVLALDGRPVMCFKDVEDAIALASATAAAPYVGDAAAGADAAKVDGAGGSRAAKRLRLMGTAVAAGARGFVEEGGEEGAVIAGAAPCVVLTICRARQVMDVVVPLGQEKGLSTDRLLHWCGAQLQATHRSARELGFLPEGQRSGVYVSRWHHGSPAHRYGLFATNWITHVNGTPTPDLDAFAAVVTPLRSGDYVRLHVCQLTTTQTQVLTLKVDLKYWPMWELRLDPHGARWTRTVLSEREP